MDLCPQNLSGPKLAVVFGYSLYVVFGQRPNGITARDHFRYEVFEFTGRLIVGHKPDADTGAAVYDGSAQRGSSRRRDSRISKPVRNRLPSGLQIVVRVHEYADGHSPLGKNLAADAVQEAFYSVFLYDAGNTYRRISLAEMEDNMLIILSFDKKDALIGQGIIAGHTATLPRSPALPR